MATCSERLKLAEPGTYVSDPGGQPGFASPFVPGMRIPGAFPRVHLLGSAVIRSWLDQESPTSGMHAWPGRGGQTLYLSGEMTVDNKQHIIPAHPLACRIPCILYTVPSEVLPSDGFPTGGQPEGTDPWARSPRILPTRHVMAWTRKPGLCMLRRQCAPRAGSRTGSEQGNCCSAGVLAPSPGGAGGHALALPAPPHAYSHCGSSTPTRHFEYILLRALCASGNGQILATSSEGAGLSAKGRSKHPVHRPYDSVLLILAAQPGELATQGEKMVEHTRVRLPGSVLEPGGRML